MRSIRVSVCIATYNGEDFIKEQVDSILVQLGADDEIVISDDSSSDNTVQIIKDYKDNRIKLFEKQTFKSPILNFENALLNAKGEFIFLADQDDIWMINKLEVMLHNLIKYDFVISDCILFGNKEVEGVSNFEFRNSRKGVIKNIFKNSYLGNCIAFKRKILTKALPFPKDIPMHDWWIGVVSNLFYNVFFIEEKLSYWRRHANNATKLNGIKSPYSLLQKISFRIIIIKSLFLVSIREFKKYINP